MTMNAEPEKIETLDDLFRASDYVKASTTNFLCGFLKSAKNRELRADELTEAVIEFADTTNRQMNQSKQAATIGDL